MRERTRSSCRVASWLLAAAACTSDQETSVAVVGASAPDGGADSARTGGSAAGGGIGGAGNGAESGGSGPETDGQPGGNSGGPAGGGAGAGGVATSIRVCQPACSRVSDCNLGLSAHDSDNYACPNDYCVYRGCNNNAECQAMGNYLCRDVEGGGVPTCVGACSTAADCATDAAPYDADNYACQDGYCAYEGCNSDVECRTLGNYVCRKADGGTPMCVEACTTAAECGSEVAPFDTDNYNCLEGSCAYRGCNSDAECRTLGHYVCR